MFDMADVSLVQLSDCFIASVQTRSVGEITGNVFRRVVSETILTVVKAVIMLKGLRGVHQTGSQDRGIVDGPVVVDVRCEPAGIEHWMNVLAARVECSGSCEDWH
jgi:hypothetical protein